jgi:glucokinase
MTPATAPRLVADIGGTNARFALQHDDRIDRMQVLACAEFATLGDALRHYLQGQGAQVRHAALGIANPVHGDRLRMTNHHWEFSIDALRRELGLDTLLVLNDFATLALALPLLPAQELRQVGGGEADERAPRAVVGAGTGLGVAGLLPAHAGSWLPVAGEGGHVSFSPADDDEAELWRFARKRHGHVSAERLLCGRGLELIHAWLCERDGAADEAGDAAAITRRAMDQSDARCARAVDMFCGMLGTLAGNVALTFDARGGLYIGGGIVPRLGEHFARSPFRARFEAKGRFATALARIPVQVIHSPWPGLLGAGAALRQHLGEPSHA